MFKFTEIEKPHIYLFGAGGTGGFALEYMTRLFANYDNQVTIDIFDGDNVESKNLKRQNFTLNDLDLNKADALVSRLSNLVVDPPKLISNPHYIVDKDELIADVLMKNDLDETAIFISAVDNIATRRLLNEIIDELKDDIDLIAIDSGNNDQGGQVVIYGKAEYKELLGDYKQVNLPNMLEMFPEINVIKNSQDENPGLVRNCAEESESKPQAMMANVRNGELIANLVYQLSQNELIDFNLYKSTIKGDTKGYVRF